MKNQTIHLGFEVGTGKPVEIPIRHMAVTGQTQEAGKTTALEALIERSKLRALAFVTKRGEGSFRNANQIKPYFRERADWVYVSSLIDATLGEKNKLLRSWLMKVCRNTQTLSEVHENVRDAKAKSKGFSESIYTEIDGYLELVVPQIARLPMADKIALSAGLNVMDLSDYSTEIQALVIRSALDWIYERESNVVTVIPEAWEFLPEGRGSPAKSGFETLCRKGGNLNNRLWIDSQDMAGVWKLALRAAAVWLIGVQRESNEVKRTLGNIPAGTAKPKPADIQQLQLGQFFVCFGNSVIKTYVQPAWMDNDAAREIAVGNRSAVDSQPPAKPVEKPVTPRKESKVSESNVEKKLDKLIDLMASQTSVVVPPQAVNAVAPLSASRPSLGGDEEALYLRFRNRLMNDPKVIAVLAQQPEIRVTVVKQEVAISSTKLIGRIALLIHRGWMDEPRTNSEIVAELGRTGGKTIAPRVSEALADLKIMGFVSDEADGWAAVKNMKKNIKQSD